jgi:hypothetical protein
MLETFPVLCPLAAWATAVAGSRIETELARENPFSDISSRVERSNTLLAVGAENSRWAV